MSEKLKKKEKERQVKDVIIWAVAAFLIPFAFINFMGFLCEEFSFLYQITPVIVIVSVLCLVLLLAKSFSIWRVIRKKKKTVPSNSI